VNTELPRTVANVLRKCASSSPIPTAVAVMACLATTIGQPAIAYLTKCMMDALVARSIGGTVRWTCAEFALVAMVAVLARVRASATILMQTRLALRLKLELARSVARRPLSEFESSAFYDTVVRSRRAAEQRAGELVSAAYDATEGMLAVLLYAVILARFSPTALLLLGTIIPSIVVDLRAANEEVVLEKKRTNVSRRASYCEDVLLKRFS
jgi:ABC-type bacteriocin/lantibiotic exporter with double-glycine peptidase domain